MFDAFMKAAKKTVEKELNDKFIFGIDKSFPTTPSFYPTEEWDGVPLKTDIRGLTDLERYVLHVFYDYEEDELTVKHGSGILDYVTIAKGIGEHLSSSVKQIHQNVEYTFFSELGVPLSIGRYYHKFARYISLHILMGNKFYTTHSIRPEKVTKDPMKSWDADSRTFTVVVNNKIYTIIPGFGRLNYRTVPGSLTLELDCRKGNLATYTKYHRIIHGDNPIEISDVTVMLKLKPIIENVLSLELKMSVYPVYILLTKAKVSKCNFKQLIKEELGEDAFEILSNLHEYSYELSDMLNSELDTIFKFSGCRRNDDIFSLTNCLNVYRLSRNWKSGFSFNVFINYLKDNGKIIPLEGGE